MRDRCDSNAFIFWSGLVFWLLLVRGVQLALNATSVSHLFDHLLLLLLESEILEVPPLGQDLHGLNVLDCCKLISVVLIAAQGVEIYLLSEAFVFSLNDLEDVGDLVTVVNFLVIDTND